MDAGERRRLVEEHLSLVRALAAQVRGSLSDRLEVDELVSYGTTGLIEAAERFDPAYGVKFSTFAYHRIKGAIFDGLRQMGQLPRSLHARARVLGNMHEVVENLAERERGAGPGGGGGGGAGGDELEQSLGAIHQALSMAAASFVTSLEGLCEEGQEFEEEQPWIDEAMVARETRARVVAAIEALPEKERHFVRKHYFEGKTLLDAGKELGLSKSWASRLHARAIELLQKNLEVVTS